MTDSGVQVLDFKGLHHEPDDASGNMHMSEYVSIRQHTLAYMSLIAQDVSNKQYLSFLRSSEHQRTQDGHKNRLISS
jgi:hypothetical protein